MQGSLASSLSTKLDSARAPLKALRDAETTLQPRRNIRIGLHNQIARIEHEQQKGNEKRVIDLREQLRKAESDDQQLEREVELLKRKAVKESEQMKWDAIREVISTSSYRMPSTNLICCSTARNSSSCRKRLHLLFLLYPPSRLLPHHPIPVHKPRVQCAHPSSALWTTTRQDTSISLPKSQLLTLADPTLEALAKAMPVNCPASTLSPPQPLARHQLLLQLAGPCRPPPRTLLAPTPLRSTPRH